MIKNESDVETIQELLKVLPENVVAAMIIKDGLESVYRAIWDLGNGTPDAILGRAVEPGALELIAIKIGDLAEAISSLEKC
jgi:hypothetical protein